MPTKINQQEFETRCNTIFNNQGYDFSHAHYINTYTPVTVVCDIHGAFMKTPKSLLRGAGCPTCTRNRTARKNSSSYDDFINKANSVHQGKYDYTNVEYINNHTHVDITCHSHGSFRQTPADHTNKRAGCPICATVQRSDKNTHTTTQFITDANAAHHSRYTYHNARYRGCYENVIITCTIHGDFTQRATDHLNGSGCPRCRMSNGEFFISAWLTDNRITFFHNHTFHDCINPRTGKRLKFDFFLPAHNLAIEFDGLQHFHPVRFNGISLETATENLIQTQYLDTLKNTYADTTNIRLIRIKYDQDIYLTLTSIPDLV